MLKLYKHCLLHICSVSQTELLNLQFKRTLLLLSCVSGNHFSSPATTSSYFPFLLFFFSHPLTNLYFPLSVFPSPQWDPGGVSVPSWQRVLSRGPVDNHPVWRGAMWQLQQPRQTLFLLSALSPSMPEHCLYHALFRIGIWGPIKTARMSQKS